MPTKDINGIIPLSLAELPEMLNADMISDYLDICYIKSLNLIKYSGMKYVKLGNTYRVPKKCFEEWLNNQVDNK